MTVRELKEILNKTDENLEVKFYNSYTSSVDGYFFREENNSPTLMLTEMKVQPRISVNR